MTHYASSTQVPIDRSKRAVEELLRKHGATGFAYGWDQTHDRLQFVLQGKAIRFLLPRLDDKAFLRSPRGRLRTPAAREALRQQGDRQRWRALYLVIRAKLEAVESGIAVFEQEFLAFIVMANDLTVGDMLVPRLNETNLSRLLTVGRPEQPR